MEDDLLQFFKAMADETRLKMIGLLARESYSGEALAEIVGVKPATVSHHLAKLAEAGLVSARMDGHAKLYTLRLDALHAMAARLLAPGTLPAEAAPDPSAPSSAQALDAFDRKVLADFRRPDGTLKQIPVQQKKLQAVLRHLVQEFEPGRRYPEKQVNALLGRYHADTASLRRALIEYRLMQRAGGVYWRTTGKE
jgi:biotin operon repressor